MSSSDQPPPDKPRRASVTVRDVARVAGVSAITVSRAINTPLQVSEATLRRVRQAVLDTGYVPNLLANGLRSNKSSRLVAAVVPTLSGPVFLETIQALTQTLAAHGYQLMLGQSEYVQAREDALLTAIIGRRPDGIVLTGITHSDAARKRLAACGIPVVETWDLTPEPIDMLVGFSHHEIGRAVCDYLLARGRRRPVLISGEDERAVRRNMGFRGRAAELGLDDVPYLLVPSPTTLKNGRSALDSLLRQYPDTDSVFCSSDMLALGVLTEAQARGLPVPGQLAVVGLGDHAFSADLHPALTTVRIDGTMMGGQAARLIIDCAEGRTPTQRVFDIGFQIISRASA